MVFRFNTPSPVGRRIEAPLGGVPPPNVFGVRRVAPRSSKIIQKSIRAPENMPRSGGVWGGVAPPARAAEDIAKVSQEVRKIIQKSLKIEP